MKMYVAIRCNEFHLVSSDGDYIAIGRVVGVGQDVDRLKDAAYDDRIPPEDTGIRAIYTDLSFLGEWGICRGTTDCHILVTAMKDVAYAIYPVKIVS